MLYKAADIINNQNNRQRFCDCQEGKFKIRNDQLKKGYYKYWWKVLQGIFICWYLKKGIYDICSTMCISWYMQCEGGEITMLLLEVKVSELQYHCEKLNNMMLVVIL